ncbi:hypothetical protein [Bosea sp. BIWAKO-01]|uniref:hypothetical protein n=1 Tax=Bosea sp. BIWAKO-01 TaxID=506668 RepID=UPI000944DDC0|nr:hypothetical protein [Bosea sp. BIWAKO-01]
MDKQLAQRIRDAAHATENSKERLLGSLVELARRPLEIDRPGAAQDAPTVLTATGDAPGEMTVVLSINELIEIIELVARTQSFGEALDAAGFVPATGVPIPLREGHGRIPLSRHKPKAP